MTDHLTAIQNYIAIAVIGGSAILLIYRIIKNSQRETLENVMLYMKLIRKGQKKKIAGKLESEISVLRQLYKSDLKTIKKELRRRVCAEECAKLRTQCIYKEVKDEKR